MSFSEVSMLYLRILSFFFLLKIRVKLRFNQVTVFFSVVRCIFDGFTCYLSCEDEDRSVNLLCSFCSRISLLNSYVSLFKILVPAFLCILEIGG